MIAGSAFALELSFDGGFVFPFAKWSESTTVLGVTEIDRATQSGLGLELGAQLLITKKFGVRAEFDYLLPKNEKHNYTLKAGNSSTKSSAIIVYADLCDAYNACNFAIGPSFVAFNKKFGELIVTPSIFFEFYRTVFGDDVHKDTLTGGGVILDYRFYINKTAGLKVGCPFVYIFSSSDNQSYVGQFQFQPQIAFVYKL